ncbi:MAG TPA: M15 family metallopeptidase [Candidatus Saccharimonadales bacterium]|nr:M15 family metallopeptidase [Candidatus Saccharimonadales bacterium]
MATNRKRDFHAQIPLNAGDIDGWKAIKITAKPEPLVPLGAYTTEMGTILTSSVYFGEHDSSPYLGKKRLEGSLLSVFVREGVAKRLLQAQQLLPEGCRLLVFDAYRPLEVQDSLFRFYRSQLHLQRPDMSEDELDAETQKYVSIPSSDPTRPSPHNTGGAVDLAIVKLPLGLLARLSRIDGRLADERLSDKSRVVLEIQKSAIVRRYAKMLNFGTAFDHGGEWAAIAYFEKRAAKGIPLAAEEAEARKNRQLLYAVMTQAGMQPYKDEWWHFNAPESQMGAAAAGLAKATYGTATFSAQNVAHEKLRQRLYHKALHVENADDPKKVTNVWPTEVIGPQNG